MTQEIDENQPPATIPAGDRALEFDFSVRAPLRAHIAKCVNAGWKPEEIVLALAEMASELVEDGDLLGKLPHAAPPIHSSDEWSGPSSANG